MTNSPATGAPTVPGTVLAGKYRVEKILGQGGMGIVVEARHIALEERVALKFLLAEYATHPEAAARFLREARAAVKIKSEHVARVSDVGTLETGAPYMVMEYLEGSDLSRVLETTGPLALHDAVDFLIQGCEAIAEAHSYGIVHRDLKPANLFLSKRPNGSPIVKVLDFGISKVSGGGVDNLTKTTAAMGSALYMSPEQMQQTRGVDHRTDIYALGVALYELLAGKQPYYAETLPQLCAEVLTGTPTPIRQARPDVPEQLAQVLEKAYARDRAQRFQSIAEFVVALAPFAPGRSQNTVDSVARMAGLPTPQVGTGMAAGGAPAPAAAPQQPVNAVGPTLAVPTVRSQSGTDPGLAAAESVPAQTAGPLVSAIPVSAPPQKSRGGMFVVIGAAALTVVGVGGFLAFRGMSSGSTAPTAAPTAVAAPGPTAATAPTTTVAADPTAPATTTATAPAVPSASADAPAASVAAPPATAAVAAPPGKPGPGAAKTGGKAKSGAGAAKTGGKAKSGAGPDVGF